MACHNSKRVPPVYPPTFKLIVEAIPKEYCKFGGSILNFSMTDDFKGADSYILRRRSIKPRQQFSSILTSGLPTARFGGHCQWGGGDRYPGPIFGEGDWYLGLKSGGGGR